VETLREKGNWAGVLRAQRKGGSFFDAQAITSLVLGQDGQPLCMLGSFIDISEKMQAKRMLLEKEEQLRQSQKMEAIGRLAGGVAHDFNNLLTLIIGHCDLIISGLESDSSVHEDVEEVQKAADRAAGLTQQLLAFSRKQVMETRVIDLNSLVTEMEKMLGRILGEDVALHSVLSDDLELIKADPGQIQQVIMNLVVNAREAMPQGGKLTIETTEVYLDDEYAHQRVDINPGIFVMLTVNDTGHGMDEETRTRIFDPFFTTRGKGTGLGLSTVHGIVKQSGGTIDVYSRPGKGTSFRLYLPKVEGGDEPPKAHRDISPSTRGTETVLIVEDEEALLALISKIIKRHGYKVLEGTGGRDALRASQQHKGTIHLLVTDVIMPNVSGRDLAGQLLQSRPDMQILFMSGYTHNAFVHNGMADEKINFIQKPFSMRDLALKIREVLDSSSHSS
jgi:signal transduction histidine kinase/ActR/RegA family two-component response regulator